MGRWRRRRGCAGACDLVVHVVSLWHCDIRIFVLSWWWRWLWWFGARGYIWSLLVASLVVCLITLGVLSIMPHTCLHLSIYVTCLEEGGGSLWELNNIRISLNILSHFVERVCAS